MSGDRTKYVVHDDDHQRRNEAPLNARAELQRVRDCLSIYLRAPDARWLDGTTLVVGRGGSGRSSVTAALCRMAAPDVDELHVFRDPYKVVGPKVKPPFDFLAVTRTVVNDRPVLHATDVANSAALAILRDTTGTDPPMRVLFAGDDPIPTCTIRAIAATPHPAIFTAQDILDVPKDVLASASNVIVTDSVTLHVLLARTGRSRRRSCDPLGLVASDRDRILLRASSDSAVWFRRDRGRVVTAYKFTKTLGPHQAMALRGTWAAGLNDFKLTTLLF